MAIPDTCPGHLDPSRPEAITPKFSSHINQCVPTVYQTGLSSFIYFFKFISLFGCFSKRALLQLWCMGSRAGLSICSLGAQLLQGMWDLSSPIRGQTCVPSTGRRILNHRTTREVSGLSLDYPVCSSLPIKTSPVFHDQFKTHLLQEAFLELLKGYLLFGVLYYPEKTYSHTSEKSIQPPQLISIINVTVMDTAALASYVTPSSCCTGVIGLRVDLCSKLVQWESFARELEI